MDPAQLEELKRQSGAAEEGQKPGGGEGDAKAKREQVRRAQEYPLRWGRKHLLNVSLTPRAHRRRR